MAARAATDGDAQAIAEIYNAGIAERIATFETRPRSPDEIQTSVLANIDRFPAIVIESQSRVVAVAWCSRYRERECYDGIAEFSVYCHPAARGHGHGRQAVLVLIDEARNRGFWKLVSRVFVENHASRSLLASVGFREVGVYLKHAQLDGVWKDCIIVELWLGDLGL